MLFLEFMILCFLVEQVIEKLSVKAPSANEKLKVLKDIAHEYNLKWDSSSTEAEFSKKHEDLLVCLLDDLFLLVNQCPFLVGGLSLLSLPHSYTSVGIDSFFSIA